MDIDIRSSENVLRNAIKSSFQTLHVDAQRKLLNKLQSPESVNGDVSGQLDPSTRKFMNLIEDSVRGLPESQKRAMLQAFATIHDEKKSHFAGLSLPKL